MKNSSFDLNVRYLDFDGRKIEIDYISSLCSDELIAYLVEGITNAKGKTLKDSLNNGDVKEELNKENYEYAMLTGCAIVKDIDKSKVYVLDTRHFPTRSIEEPDTEKSVRGSKDGFNENLLNCAGLIRRRIRTLDLVMEKVVVGKKNKLDICLCYLKSEIDQTMLKSIKERLNEIKNEDVQECLNVLRDPSKEEIKAQGDKIINELGKDYKNLHFTPESVQNEGNSDKNNISIFISENDKIIKCKDKNGIINIPIEEIEDEKKDMYKRLDIGKKCRKVIKKSTGNRRLGLMLKRKVNPEIVRALDSTGNRDLIEKYIESVYNKSEFPFELKHDLSGLNIREKFKLRKYTKTEEKCGAEILGKIWNKNKTLSEGKQNVNELEQESKDEIAASVRKIIAKEKEEKENASFVQKVDGKNAEIAEKYNENNKTQNEYENMPLADLLNELEVSDTAKLTIANYANKYGEKEAKEKFEKGLAPARTRLSMKNFVNQAKEERKPGNQQIKEDTQKSDDEGR